MLFIHSLTRELYHSPAPFITRVRGLLVNFVWPAWNAPLRLFLARKGEVPICIWAGEPIVDRYHLIDLKIWPHGEQALYVIGGNLVLSGEYGVCACCVSTDKEAIELLRDDTSSKKKSTVEKSSVNQRFSVQMVEDWDV